MSLHARRSTFRELRVEILTSLVILLVLGGLQFRDRPVIRSPQPDAAARAPGPDHGTGDVAIVLPSEAHANSLEQLTFDQAWLNAVESEIGTASTIPALALRGDRLQEHGWIIVPRKAGAELDASQIQALDQWTRRGGVLLLEQPEGPWGDLIGIHPAGTGLRTTRRFTAFDGAISRGDIREDILQMPLRTTLAPFQPPHLARGRDYRVLLEVDGLPGVVAIPRDDGLILLILFHHARAATVTRQGLPDNSFLLPARDADDVPLWTRARDSVADEALLQNHIPFVDLLERNLLYLADSHRPVGRIWQYPGQRRGALIATHSEGGIGARAEYLAEWERRNEVRASYFVRHGSLDHAALIRMGRRGADLHVELVPSVHPGAPQHRWQLGRFSPIRRPMNLQAQLDLLRDDLHPYGPPRASRVADSLRPVGYFDLWRFVQATGLHVDSTLGPAPHPDEEAWGYLFGTGRPFRPIDQSGNRFQVLALPHQATDISAGYTLGRLRRLTVDAAEKYHATIVVDWRANTMIDRPDWDVIEGWRNIFSLAESQDLWVTTMSEYLDFLDMRRRSSASSSFDPASRTLTIRARTAGPERYDGDVAQISPSISFPVRHEGRPVDTVTLNGMEISSADLTMTGDRILFLLPVPPGDHEIRITWASPVTPRATGSP
ncbi:MAG: hypothetical protein EA398_07280 [Deltaproteobacteria bacterium]|nr:MAG: hypothetical protein EA398_07280 [Deltaproteobacteria bacterium]